MASTISIPTAANVGGFSTVWFEYTRKTLTS
jgi:hypothetical protein